MRLVILHGNRQVDDNAIDYGDGAVMIGYTGTRDVAIVPKTELRKMQMTDAEYVEYVRAGVIPNGNDSL